MIPLFVSLCSLLAIASPCLHLLLNLSHFASAPRPTFPYTSPHPSLPRTSMPASHWNTQACNRPSHLPTTPQKGEKQKLSNKDIFLKSYGPGLPWRLGRKEFACQCRRQGFDPWTGKIPQATGQLSPRLCSKASEPQLPKPESPTAHAPQREATTVRSPCAATREKPTQQWRPSTAKNKQIKL